MFSKNCDQLNCRCISTNPVRWMLKERRNNSPYKRELAERELWRFWSRGLRFLHIVKMESLNHFYHCNTVLYVNAMVFYEQGDTLQLS